MKRILQTITILGFIVAILTFLLGNNVITRFTGRDPIAREAEVRSVSGWNPSPIDESQILDASSDNSECSSQLPHGERPTPLIAGEEHADNIAVETNFNDYCFFVLRNESLKITATPLAGQKLDLVIELYSGSSILLLTMDETLIFMPEELILEAEAGREYLIRIRGFAGSKGSYTLVLSPESE